jgi:hypothetical protein
MVRFGSLAELQALNSLTAASEREAVTQTKLFDFPDLLSAILFENFLDLVVWRLLRKLNAAFLQKDIVRITQIRSQLVPLGCRFDLRRKYVESI